MSDLISRQAAIDKLQKEINKGIPPFDDVIGSLRCGVRLARNIIEDLPSAEPKAAVLKVEVSAEEAMETVKNNLSDYFDTLWKTAYERGKAEADPREGKWIDYCGGVKCDQCGFECDDTYYLGEANFCPNCGAKMEENDDH